MVFKKYIRKNGKIFGPYLYENKRINGKVVTTYVGIPSNANKAKNKFKINYSFLLIFFLVVLLLFFIFQGFSTTGRAALDIKSKYKAGENLAGSLKFNLRAGELIPKNSKVKIGFGGAEYEKNFNELINEDITNGKFYVEGLNLTGEGEGYGIDGKSSPNVEFELKIINKQEDENISGIEKGESKEDEKADERNGKEERTNETIADEEENEIGGETIEKEGEKADEDNAKEEGSLDEKPNENIDNEVEEKSGEINGGESNAPSEGDSDSGSESGGSDSGGSSKGSGGESSGSTLESGGSNGGDGVSSGGESASSGGSSGGGDSGSSGSDGGGSITGAVISENANIISGVVTKSKKFSYTLEEGQTAEIVSGSVKVNEVVINDNEIKLRLKEKEVEVTTDYSEDETGFGEKYLGENALFLEVDLSKFDIIVNESSELKVELVYGDKVIVKASEEILIEGKVEEKNKSEEEIEIVNETVANVIVNTTNIGVVNASLIENVSVNITQFSARLGEPVKWIKKINMSGPATIIVDIPLSASNISIKKIEKLQDIAEEDANENIDNDLGSDNSVIANETNEEINESAIVENDNKENSSGAIDDAIVKKEDSELGENVEIEKEERKIKVSINGDVTADIELKKEPKIISWLKKLFSFTGFVVSEEANNTKEVVVELNSTEEAFEIEYYTDAPSLGFEEEIEHGKRVQVSSPEDVHYENVLLFTNLSEKLGIKSINNLKIYWNENESYIPIYNASDIDGNEIIDYVEWIAPRLSNQTYDVIVIVKAEHLDANRSFISDIYDEVRFLDRIWSEAINDGEYVRVVFEKLLNKNRDITVYPRVVSGSPLIEVYEFNKDEKIAEFIDIKSNKYNKVYLTNLNGEQDTFDLRVINGTLEFDYIVDPITLVQNATFGHTAASPATNAGAVLASAPTADNLLIIAIASDKSAGAYTVPNGFTLIESRIGTSVSGAMAYKISNGTEQSANWTYTTSQESAVWYAEYSGLATSSVLDLAAENNSIDENTTRQVTMENLTNTAQADELAVAMYGIDTDGSVGTESWSNGFTKVVFVNPPSAGTAGLGAADKVLSAIGSVSTVFSFTGGTVDQMYGILATFKAASDTTPPIVTIVFPTNTTYGSANLPLNFNVSLDENGSVIYSLNNGAINVSMTSTDEGSKFGKKFNMTNTSIADGGYRFSVYANDTTGNKNYTAKVDFSFLNTNIDSCQNLNTANINYNLTVNVSATGNCFNVTEENITLLGNGFTATFNTGNAATAGINVTKTNFTLRDLKLTTTQHTGIPAGMQILSNLAVIVRNVNISMAGASNDYAIHFTGQNSTAAVFDSYIGSGVSSGSDYELAFIGSGNNISLVNVTLKNHVFVWNNTNSFFTKDYYLDVQVNDSNNQGIQNANVSAWDVNGRWQFSILTGNKGVIDQQHLANNKTNTSGQFYIYNNYSINATSPNYNDNSQSWNMTTHRSLLFNLTNVSASPYFIINSPTNNSDVTTPTAFLNWTVQDNDNSNEIFVWASNDSVDINDHLIYHKLSQANGTYTYNWSGLSISSNLSGLVGLWHFDNLSSLGENMTRFVDSAKNGIKQDNATAYGTPKFTETGIYAGAIGLSSGNSAWIANSLELSASPEYTIMGWFNMTSNGTSVSSGTGGLSVYPLVNKGIGEAESATQDVYFFVGVNSSNNKFCNDYENNINSSNHPVCGSTTIQTDIWYFFTVVKNITSTVIYLNGVQDGKINVLTNATTSSIHRVGIGIAHNSINTSSGVFNGFVDEIAFFNRSMTIAEVRNYYNLSLGRKFWRVNATDGTNMNSSGEYVFNLTVAAVPDTTPPIVTIVFPTNTTYNSGNLPLNFNVSLDENGSVIYSLNNGAINVSMTSTDEGSKFGKKFNMTNTSIGDGGYRFSVYANDTAGNKNYTAKVDFSFDGTYPNVNFVNPTLSSGSYTNNGSVEINVSIVESLLGELKFNWNVTNYTYYDNSLYALVNFENYSTLGENDTHVKDFSIYGNNGTVQGGIFWNATKGKYFGAYDFVNANNYIAVGGAGLPSIPDLYTIEAWAYFNDYSDGFGMIWSRNNNTGNVIFNLLGVRNSSGRLDVSHNNNLVATTGISVSTGVWNHYVARYNSSTFSLFIDGVERYKEVAGAITLPTTCAILLGIDSDSGCEASFGSDDLNGSVDNFMFYNRSLSDDEIRQHYFMNLYKYNSSNWVLYVNQSLNSSTGLSDGNYTYLASAKDRAGNENVSKTRSVFVDRTPALVLINSPSNNSDVTTPTAFLSWNVTDAGNNNEIWVYGKNDTSNIFNFLIYHQQAQANGTFNYNWSGLTVDPNSAKLTLLYHFDNNSNYGENLGLVYDFTGGAKNATCSGTGCPAFNFNGKFAGNMKFDGVDDGLVVSDDAAGGKLDYLINFTILGWVNMTGNGVFISSGADGCDNNPVITKGHGISEDTDNDLSFYIGINASTRKICFDMEATTSANNPVSSTTTFDNGELHHFAAVYNGSTSMIYVDGILESSLVWAGTPTLNNSHDVGIGRSCNHQTCTSGAFNGTIDEIAVFNRSLTTAEIRNYYNLSLGKKYWVVNASDIAGNVNGSGNYEFNMTAANVAPNNATPIINSTDGSNRTGQNLNCFDVLSDDNADRMNVTVKWFNGTKDYLTVYYNNSYVNGTLFNAVLNSANTTKGQNWSCGMRFFDGAAYNSWVNSSNLTILNTLPTVTLSSPANGNITTNRTPTFTWSGNDDDSDSLQFELNLTCYSACSGDNRYVTRATIGASTSYTITPYLKYLIDNGYSYNWTVRAWDGVDYGDWVTAERNISIQSVVSISLPVASVNFSVLNVTGRDNTSDNSPYPLVLQNDGNSWVNVSVNFTSLFLSTPSPTSNFQFMVRNSTNSCFTPSGTQITYTNAPLLTTSIINQFNFTGGYQVGCNNVSIDLLVNIPTDEPPGDKSSLVTFTSALAEY